MKPTPSDDAWTLYEGEQILIAQATNGLTIHVGSDLNIGGGPRAVFVAESDDKARFIMGQLLANEAWGTGPAADDEADEDTDEQEPETPEPDEEPEVEEDDILDGLDDLDEDEDDEDDYDDDDWDDDDDDDIEDS